MIEGVYLWEQVCESADPQDYVSKLNDQELGMLRAHVEHIAKRNGALSGVPALILGLVEMEAAGRFFTA
jgi:hypothetical protein